MKDIFRLKIVAKRQVTIPQVLMERLHLEEGDELELEINDHDEVALRPMKVVPVQLFSREMLAKLKNRAQKMADGIVSPPPRKVRQAAPRAPKASRANAEQLEQQAQAGGETTTRAY